MSKILKIAVLGAAGRMGRELMRTVIDCEDAVVAGALVRPGSIEEGVDIGELVGLGRVGIPAATELPMQVDVLVDFSTEGLIQWLPRCAERGLAIVSGATGLDDQAVAALDEVAGSIPVLWAPNLSVGVQLCYRLVAQAALAIGDQADIEVLEAHHRYKKDAPSGTALRLGQVAAEVSRRPLDTHARYARHGPDVARQPGEIGFSVVRAGDIVGEHTVLFAMDGERVEITHRASSRQAFVQGAIRAAHWIKGRPAGRYGLDDVLGMGG